MGSIACPSPHVIARGTSGPFTAGRHLGVIRAPSGAVIAEVIDERGQHVLVRRVAEDRHLYRLRDAWPLGAHALGQALQLGVDVLRYVAGEGIYEVRLAAFVVCSERLLFSHEAQHVLPRSRWLFTPHSGPRVEQLTLLGIGQ